VQEQPELVGIEALAAQAIRLKVHLEVLDPVLTLAPANVPVVEFLRHGFFAGHHGAPVGALLYHLRVVGYPSLIAPAPAW
jgi:hypothetical protein